ncbi:sigma-70 family RNA polymerase sigma factor [Paenisporosarcina sp. TG20]|uniref:sigma-70 family RNA polymerase sigma factor n=1 Tax=Paenisporosarcina sp. TG20 TaxID=1211706 RepID=UPI00031B3F9E|nr:sigma-70 family RNA polymerase sigma factor [Paenisporosarcina sp. TG20]
MKDLFSSSSTNVENYLNKFEKHLQNPVIKSFLEIPDNMDLLVEVIENPTNLSKKKLDDTFREYYFTIRFTNYLSQTIYFNAINYDKKVNLYLERNKSILDCQLKDRYVPLLDYLASKEWQEEGQEVYITSSNIADHLTSYSLYKAIQFLTENQRQLLNLTYIYGLNDSEIAVYLNKSQQAVSRSHKKALKKLKNSLKTDREGRGRNE